MALGLFGGGRSDNSAYYFYGQLSSSERVVYDELLRGLMAMQSSIPFSSGVSFDMISRMVELVLNDHPEIFWFSGAGNMSQRGSSFSFQPKYTISRETKQEREARIRRVVSEFLESTRRCRTDVECLEAAFNYLVKNVSCVLFPLSVLIAVFGDELHSGAMPVAIGRGLSRGKVLLAKYFDCVIFMAAQFLICLGCILLFDSIAGIIASNEDNIRIVLNIILNGFFPVSTASADDTSGSEWLVNEAGTRLRYQCADIFDLLPALHREGEQYDVVILDPPAFTKSRNSVKAAVRGYREINQRGLRLVRDGGFLATCSCSHFMTPDLFRDTIAQAARDAHKRLRQVEFRTQAPDHPILWASEESYYLKFYIFQVLEEK